MLTRTPLATNDGLHSNIPKALMGINGATDLELSEAAEVFMKAKLLSTQPSERDWINNLIAELPAAAVESATAVTANASAEQLQNDPTKQGTPPDSTLEDTGSGSSSSGGSGGGGASKGAGGNQDCDSDTNSIHRINNAADRGGRGGGGGGGRGGGGGGGSGAGAGGKETVVKVAPVLAALLGIKDLDDASEWFRSVFRKEWQHIKAPWPEEPLLANGFVTVRRRKRREKQFREIGVFLHCCDCLL